MKAMIDRRVKEASFSPIIGSSAVAEGLNKALSDTFVLYVKTLNFHWNVTGSQFFSLHEYTDKLYRQMVDMIDVLGERVRMLGYEAVGSMKEFQALSSLKESQKLRGDDVDIETLVGDHCQVIRILREVCSIATGNQDPVTEDILIQQIQSHEDAVWRLTSLKPQAME